MSAPEFLFSFDVTFRDRRYPSGHSPGMIVISKDSSGKLIASTYVAYIEYVSEPISAEFLGDLTTEAFSCMHMRFPPVLYDEGPGIIALKYEIPFMQKTLLFRLIRHTPSTEFDVMALHGQLVGEIRSLEEEFEILRRELVELEKKYAFLRSGKISKKSTIINIMTNSGGQVYASSSEATPQIMESIRRLLPVDAHEYYDTWEWYDQVRRTRDRMKNEFSHASCSNYEKWFSDAIGMKSKKYPPTHLATLCRRLGVRSLNIFSIHLNESN